MKRFMSLNRFCATLFALAATLCAHPADPKGDIIKYLLYGQDGVTTQYATTIMETEGWVGAGGGEGTKLGGGDVVTLGAPIVTHGVLNLGQGGTATKNWWVEGNVTSGATWWSMTVHGDIRATGSIASNYSVASGNVKSANDATVAGLVPDINIANFIYDVPVGSGSQTVSGGTLDPGYYGNVTIDGLVTFKEGDYYFENLSYRSTVHSGILISKPKGTTTRIFVRDQISFGTNDTYGIKLDRSNGDEYGRVLLYVQNQLSWTIRNNPGPDFGLDATVLMPNATVSIGTDTKLHGQVLAKKITAGNALVLDGDAFHPWDPSGISLVGASTITLPEHHATCAGPTPGNTCSHLEQLSVRTGKTSGGDITVKYRVQPLPSGNADSAATLNSDFSLTANGAAASGTLTIPAGKTDATEKIKIWVIDDAEDEPEREFVELLLYDAAPDSSAVLLADPAAFRMVTVGGRIDTLVYRIPIIDDEEPNNPPSGRDTTLATNEDTPLNASVQVTDPNNDPWEIFVTTQPLHGTVVITDAATGAFTYTPNPDYNGPDVIGFKARDQFKESYDEFRATITVRPVNDKPKANDDTLYVMSASDVRLTVNAAKGVLKNDTDIDGDALTAAKVTDPAHGTVDVNSDGSFTYQLNGDWSGTESFTYKACDAGGLCDTATVKIKVKAINHAPVAVRDPFDLDEDVPLIVFDALLLANDTDPDGDELTVATYPDLPAHGMWDAATHTYTPNPDFNGYDSLSYKVTDGETQSDKAWIVIHVLPVNDAPVANPAQYRTNQETQLVVSVAEGLVQQFASDVDGDALTASLVSAPRHGTLAGDTVAADGSFTYNPAAGYFGEDTLVYAVQDPAGRTATNVAIIKVIKTGLIPPDLSPAEYVVPENSPAGTQVGNYASNITWKDLDTWTSISLSGEGADKFAIAQNGKITVKSGANLDYEADSLYTLTVDVDGTQSTVTIKVSNQIEAPSMPNLGPWSVTENDVGARAGTAMLTSPSSYPPSAFSIVGGTATYKDWFEILSNGVVKLKDGKSLDYEQVKSVTLKIRATNSDGQAEKDVTINVRPVNEPFTVAKKTLTVPENSPVNTRVDTTAVAGNSALRTAIDDPDCLGDQHCGPYTYTLQTADAPFKINPNTGALTVNGPIDYESRKSYTLTVGVTDGLYPRTMTVEVNVTDANDLPVVTHAVDTIPANAPAGTHVATVTATDEDRPANTLSYFIVVGGELAQSDSRFTIDSDGEVTVIEGAVLDFKATPKIPLVVDVFDGTAHVRDTMTVVLKDVRTHLDLVEVTDGDSTWAKPDTVWTNRDTIVATYDYGDGDSTGTETYVVTIEDNGDTTFSKTWTEPGAASDSTVSFVVRYNSVAPDVAIHVPDLVKEPTVDQPMIDSTGMIWTNDPKQPLELVAKYIDAALKKRTDSTLASGKLTAKQKRAGWTVRYLDSKGAERDSLSEGVNTVIATYRDVYGNVGADTLRITLDTDAPKVKILNPETGDTFERLRLDVEWTVNGELQDRLTTESVALGENWIVREEIDFAGNRGADSVRVVITSQGNEVKIALETPLVDNADEDKVIDYIDDISKAVESATGNSTFTAEDGETIDLGDPVNLAKTGLYAVTVLNQETGKEELLVVGADGKRVRFAAEDLDPNDPTGENGGNGGNGGSGNNGGVSADKRPAISRKDGHQGVTMVLDLSFPLNNIADEDGSLQGVYADTVASAPAKTISAILLANAGGNGGGSSSSGNGGSSGSGSSSSGNGGSSSSGSGLSSGSSGSDAAAEAALLKKLSNVKSYAGLLALLGEEGIDQLEEAMGLEPGRIADSYEAGTPIEFQITGKGEKQKVEVLEMRAMYVLKVQDIRMDYFDNLGQFVKGVTIPGFVFDQSAYQNNDGKVKVFVELLPNITDGSTCGGMTDEKGREWGTGAFLVKTLVRTRAIPADGCESCIKQTFSEETVKLFGYRRKACEK